jgi:hypothetical protein
VWHASVACHSRQVPALAEFEQRALRALRHVGSSRLGEWAEHTDKAFHLRRRLSNAECIEHDLTMRDVRHTPEYAERLAPLAGIVPPHLLFIDHG